MKNLPFFKKLEDAKSENNIDSIPERASWILGNFHHFKSLHEDKEIQLEIINHFKETHPGLCIEFFSSFPKLVDEIELQRFLIESCLESGRIMEDVLYQGHCFPVLYSDLGLLKKVIDITLNFDTRFVIRQLSRLNIKDQEFLYQVQRKIVTDLINRNSSGVRVVMDYWSNFETLHDCPEIATQIFEKRLGFCDDYEIQQDVLEELSNYPSLHSSPGHTLRVAVRSMKTSPYATMTRFNCFVALKNNEEYQLRFVEEMVEYSEYRIIDLINMYPDSLDAFRQKESQRKFIELLTKYDSGLKRVLQQFHVFDQFQKDKDFQNQLINKALEKELYYDVLRRFDKFLAFKGDSKNQEIIFIECMKHVRSDEAFVSIKRFDTLEKKEDLFNRAAISYAASYSFIDEERVKDSERLKSLIMKSYYEALSVGNWDIAMQLVRDNSVRNFFQKDWKKNALEYIKKRELEDYEVFSRYGWVDGQSISVLQDNEKFWLEYLKKVLSFKNIQPSSELKYAYDHYREANQSTKDFIVNMLHNGQTIAENVLSVLKNIEETKENISLPLQKIVQRMANSPFKGFSESTFRVIANLDSTKSQDEQLKEWANQAQTILTCLPLSEEFRNTQYYEELVYAAYRPSGFSISRIKDLLKDKFNSYDEKDWMRHVNRWKTKNWKLMEAKGYRIRNNNELDPDLNSRINKWLEIFSKRDEEVDIERFCRILFSIAKGRSYQPKDGDNEFLLHYLLSKEDHPLTKFFVEFLKVHKQDSLDSNVNLIHEVVSQYVESMYGVNIQKFFVNEILVLLKSEDEMVQKWMSKMVQKLNRGSIQLINRIKKQNVNIGAEEVYAEVMGSLFVKSSSVRKDHRYYIQQLKKFEAIDAGYSYPIEAIMSKSLESILSRASAGLCTKADFQIFQSSDFLQISLIDKRMGLIVGNIQLHLFNYNKILARLNPSSKFLLSGVDHEKLACEMIRICHEFADLNKLELFIPPQTSWHQLTNRDNTIFEDTLLRFLGKERQFTVSLSSYHEAEFVHECLRSMSN